MEVLQWRQKGNNLSGISPCVRQDLKGNNWLVAERVVDLL